jgi:hypothetical protein
VHGAYACLCLCVCDEAYIAVVCGDVMSSRGAMTDGQVRGFSGIIEFEQV